MPASTQHVAVEADAGDGGAGELLREPTERRLVAVDHRDGVASAVERAGQSGSDPATPHDHDVHGCSLPVGRSSVDAHRPIRDGCRRARVPSVDRPMRWRCRPCPEASLGTATDRGVPCGPRVAARAHHQRGETARGRPGTAQYADARDPAAQADRPAGVRFRRAVVGRLCAERDLPDAVAGGCHGLRLQLEGRAAGVVGHAGGGRVLPAERARLPLRWRRLRGGHHQPRSQRRPDGRRGPPRRLRPDGRGVDLLGRPVRGLGHLRAARSRGHCRGDRGHPDHRGEPARGQGVGDGLRHTHLRLHDLDPRHGRVGRVPDAVRSAPGRHQLGVHHRRRSTLQRRQPRDARRGLPAAACVLVGMRGAHGCGGHQQRRPGLPDAEVQERRHHARAARRRWRSR